ncbi:MAG: hypothetical protein HUJ25_03475 [Crocinitomicaceae bacterium]|nr:hypothetical protein [Crocinitomicaceae bacterium]
MSALDIVDDIFYYIKRYIFPALFLVLGVFALFAAVTPQEIELNNGQVLQVEQNKLFLAGSLVLIIGSVIWVLYLVGVINSMVGYVVMTLLAIGSAVVIYYDYVVVREQVRFENMYAERATEIKTRIMDIKAAQLAYKESKGTFTDSFDDLIKFVKNGEVMDFIKNGSLPDRRITPEERDLIYGDDRPIDKLMTEEEATFLARKNGGKIDGKDFQRDTIFVSVMESIFNSDRYQTAREKLGGQIPFHPDSMRYVPYSQNPAEIDTGSVMKGDLRVATLRILMTHPMQHPIDGYVDYTVGALDDNHLRESWDK